MKVAFHVSNFTVRGTETALFDYAYYNIHLLNNSSIIVAPLVQELTPNLEVVKRFGNTFGGIFYYSSNEELENYLRKEKVDCIYTIKYGNKDKFLWTIPTLVHCVYQMKEPHGVVYAGVSESVCRRSSYPFVPHIISLPNDKKDFRSMLKIPPEDAVIGRLGGSDTFDITFVLKLILNVLEKRNDLWFLFAVKPDIMKNVKHPRIKYIDSFVDTVIKRRFINTCDAGIDASSLGQSFGLAILEFSFCNKPNIVYKGGLWHTQHLANLGDKAITYSNEEDLLDILINFKREDHLNKDYNITEKFSPQNVMNKFKKVFLDPVKK